MNRFENILLQVVLELEPSAYETSIYRYFEATGEQTNREEILKGLAALIKHGLLQPQNREGYWDATEAGRTWFSKEER